MRTVQYLAEILKELDLAGSAVEDGEAERLADSIIGAGKIFTAGAGRSGLMAKAFAMRLMQMGFDAHVVGETVTPGLARGDLLVVASGSGETRSLVVTAEKAAGLGASVAALTIAPDSTIGKLAGMIVRLPGSTKDRADGGKVTIQPMGALFEQILLLFFDAVILRLMELKGMDSHAMYGRHANLELSRELATN